MTGFLLPMLGVMLLFDPHEVIDAEAAAAISEDANAVQLSTGPRQRKERSKTMRIRSETSDFDRSERVILFEGHVLVEYEDDYSMCADQIYAFLTPSNRLSRVVAVGNVAITNETRVGRCALATYRKNKLEIEMYGEKGGSAASLVESGEGASELFGDCIRFYLDSEQVQVENSRISAQGVGKEKML